MKTCKLMIDVDLLDPDPHKARAAAEHVTARVKALLNEEEAQGRVRYVNFDTTTYCPADEQPTIGRG